MAVQAQLGGLVLPVPLPPYAADEKNEKRALKDYGALLSAAAVVPGADDSYYACQQYDYCAAQSELTCNGGVGGAAVRVPSRKRGREEEDDDLHHYAPLLPPPGTRPHVADSSATAAVPSTSERRGQAPAAEHDLWRRQGAEVVDALVRSECDRLRAGLELARQRQRWALVRVAAVSSGLARRAREAEAQLEAARRRGRELEERVRHAAAEQQAWCGVARGNEAVVAGLRATLDALLLRTSSLSADAAAAAAEGFGESEPDDAQSSCCCYVEEAVDAAAAASSSWKWNGKWACRACGEREASVLVLPCRHLCLCKACEPRADACPVCLATKKACIHVAPN